MKPKELSHDYGLSGTWPPQVLNLSHLLPKSACLTTAPTISNSSQSSQASSIHMSAYKMFVQFSCHVPAVAKTPILHTSCFAEQVQRTHLWGQELPAVQLQWVTWGSTSVVDDWQSLMKPLRGQQGFDATVCFHSAFSGFPPWFRITASWNCNPRWQRLLDCHRVLAQIPMDCLLLCASLSP